MGAPTGELARGLYFYHARYYDPTLARFIQPDTIVPNPGDPQSLNRYSYAANNPVRYTDPSGHYLVLEGDPGSETEFAVRRQGDTSVVLHGGRVFPNDVEVAIANYELTGDPRYLVRLPEMEGLAGAAMPGTLVNVNTELGYEYRSWRGRVWGAIGAMALGAGMSFKPGSEEGPSPRGRFVRKTLPPLPEKFRSAFEGEPVVRTLQPGEKLYRAELSDRPVGRWFGTQPTTSLVQLFVNKFRVLVYLGKEVNNARSQA